MTDITADTMHLAIESLIASIADWVELPGRIVDLGSFEISGDAGLPIMARRIQIEGTEFRCLVWQHREVRFDA